MKTLVIYFLLLQFVILYFIFIIRGGNHKESKEIEYRKIFNREKMNDIFSYIYKNNIWSGGSGPGSFKECTTEYLDFLHNFIYLRDIITITDLGCGDWQMFEHFNFSERIIYYGYDVVDNVIESDKKKYGKRNINFYLLETTSTMKIADLLIVKDVFIHWKNDIIINFLENIAIKYKYVILVNDFVKGKENIDIEIGKFRPLNLEIPPFNSTHFIEHIDMMFCKTLKRIYIMLNKIS